MDYILDMVIIFSWIVAFYLGFFAVHKLLDSKFIKSEDVGKRWNDLRESLITLLSLMGGGLVVTSIVANDKINHVKIIRIGEEAKKFGSGDFD